MDEKFLQKYSLRQFAIRISAMYNGSLPHLTVGY